MKKFGDKDKESTFPEGNRAACRCVKVCMETQTIRRSLPTTTLSTTPFRNLKGRHLPAAKSAEKL